LSVPIKTNFKDSGFAENFNCVLQELTGTAAMSFAICNLFQVKQSDWVKALLI